MAPIKSVELVNYQATLIERIPTTVSVAYRDAVIETVERLIDNVNPEETNLRWRIQAAYHSDTEPASHEVIALALTFESGAFEGSLLKVQRAFYKKHPKIRRHQKEWSIPGLTGAIDCAWESDDDDDIVVIDNGEGPSAQKTPARKTPAQETKRKVSEIIDLTASESPKVKKQMTHNGSSHIESENTPRLNQLARLPPPIAEKTPPPPHTVKVPSFALARLPGQSRPSPVIPRINLAAADNQANPGPSFNTAATDGSKHKELLVKITTIHKQVVEVNSHAETLRKELVATSERRAADDDESLQGFNDYVNTYNSLSSRTLKCHEDTITLINSALRLHTEFVPVIEDLQNRLEKVEKATTELVGAARREADLRGQHKQERK